MSRETDARRLWAIHPKLGAAFIQVSSAFELAFIGNRLGIAQGYRTPGVQASAAGLGRSPFDGKTSFSKHQAMPALAFDFAVMDPQEPTGMVQDGSDQRYRWVGKRFEQLGFVWGGGWKKPDWDHVELPLSGPAAEQADAGLTTYLRVVAAAPWLELP